MLEDNLITPQTKQQKIQRSTLTGVDEEYTAKFQNTIQDPEKSEDFLYGKFPKGFLLGAATAAYQVEGGWNADGKGESMWDHTVKTKPDFIEDGSNADQGCDSYKRYKDDVRILKELNATVYRFSINWARILPNGEPNEINQPGIDYYNNLINELVANGIEPIVTLYHWDLPQAIVEKYALIDEDIIEYFIHFARVCFENFADRVKYWITVNEPWIYAVLSYDVGTFPPFAKNPVDAYKCVHNLLKIHASMYRLYEKDFKPKFHGKVGLNFDSWGFEPMDPDSEEDGQAIDKQFIFRNGILLDPVTTGDYPPLMREIIDRKSKEEGATESRLPKFNAEWSKKLKGSFDFLGLNHYSCEKVTSMQRAPHDKTRLVFGMNENMGLHADSDNFGYHDADWPSGKSWWLKHTPWALRKLLNKIKDAYGNPEIIIAENGWSDGKQILHDPDRLNYFKAYLNEALKAVVLDGCNLKGYCAWTLLDSWEWNAGYSVSFGLYHVNLKDPSKKRTARTSAKYLSQVYRNHGFLKQ